MLRLSTQVNNNVCVIAIDGNIVADGAYELNQYVMPFLNNKAVKGIVLNLQKSTYMDSSGIGIVVKIFKTLKARGAKFVLCQIHPKFKEVLKTVQLLDLFTVCETEEEAVNHILIALELGNK